MTKDEALDLALEALESTETKDHRIQYGIERKAITAIKQARSAPAQEPVAFNAGVPPLYPEMKDGETISVEYTTPPAQPAPVQEPEYVYTCIGCNALYREDDVSCDCTVHGLMEFTRHILAPNTTPPGGRQSEDCRTAAQEDIQRLSALVRAQQITIDKLEQARSAPVQEPVATIDSLEQEIYENTREFVSLNVMEWLLKRLNTTPPAARRQWVGLTDEEIEAVWYDHHDREMGYAMRFARAIEAKLKEKNT